MARTEGGINNLNSDDPVLNRQMFASFANGGEVESTQSENQEAPPLGRETIKVDTLPEVKAANEITEEDIERNEPVSQPPSVTTTVSTQTQPVLTNQEKLSMFLFPMAAELLNARTPGGMSNFTSFLQAAGRGLARVPQTIMGIKQLEAKGLETKAAAKPLDYVFTKPFTLDGVTYQADQRAQLSAEQVNAISKLDATAVVPYKDPASKSATSIKDVKTGLATYLTEQEALKQNPPAIFGDFYKQLVAPTPDLEGKPIVAPNGQPLQYKEFYQGANVVRKSLVPTSVKPQDPVQSSGSFARYVASEEDARAYLTANGIKKEDVPNYDLLIESLIAPSPSLEGSEVVEGNSFVTLNTTKKGGKVINASLTPFKGATPNIVESRKKRLQLLAKTLEEMKGQTEAVTRAEMLLPLFLTGEAQTDKIEAATMLGRELFVGLGLATEATKDKLTIQQLIESSSFALAPVMRATGSGSTSDMEFKAYQRAIVDIGATERANYITLYTFAKLKNLTQKRAIKEQELLERNAPDAEIKKELKKLDTGIYASYKGDPNDAEAVSKFVDSLPPGTIIYQNQEDLQKYKNDAGEIVYPFLKRDGSPNTKTFIIKGWKGGK